MSKLTEVRTALAARDDVVVVDEEVEVFLPNPHGYFTHTVDIVVVPASGLYAVDQLQSFMMGLVPIVPTQKDDFRGSDSHMEFGKLYFDEPIGSDNHVGTRTITITDPDIELPAEYVDGCHEIDLGFSKQLERRTWVRVYPSIENARHALAGVDKFSTNNLLVPSTR